MNPYLNVLALLSLQHLNGLYSLMIDEGASPLLERLVIGPCSQLKEVPSGIQHLRNLKDLRFLDMPKEFEERFVEAFNSRFQL